MLGDTPIRQEEVTSIHGDKLDQNERLDRLFISEKLEEKQRNV